MTLIRPHRRLRDIPLGAPVYDVADPRHVGRLVAVNWSRAKIRFPRSGWLALVAAPDVREATEEEIDA